MAFASSPALALGAAPRVNLLPRTEIDRRARGALLRRWGFALAAALLVVLLVAAFTFWLQTSAAMRLAAENARTNALLTEVAALQPVRDKLTLESELTDYRTQAMGTDLTWATVSATAEKALPDDVVLAGFSLTPGSLPVGDDPTLEPGVAGTLTLTSPSAVDIVPYVRELRALPGVMSNQTDGWAVETDGDSYKYTIRVVIDQSVYTNAFAEVDE